MITLFVLIFSILVNLILGLAVYVKNNNSLTNRLFALLAIGLSGWSIVSYLSLNTEENQLLLIRLTMFFVVFINSIFLFLAHSFPDSRIAFTKKLRYIASYCLITLIVTLSPLLFTGLTKSVDGDISPVPGPGMVLFLVHAILCFIGGPVLLIKRYMKSSGLARLQIRYVTVGTLLLFTLLPLTNFIFPIVFSDSRFINLSPVYAAFFAGIIGYAIIRHKLLDIRAIVARSIAYILSIGLITAGYGLSSTLVLNIIFEQDSGIPIIANAGVLIVAVLLYHPVKNFFDKITNRLFYRDAYDPQVFLDQLNKALVNNLELEILLRHTSQVIERNLKCYSCNFVINESEDNNERIIGDNDSNLKIADIKELKEKLKKYHNRIVITDNLGTDHKYLNKYLDDRGISVAVSLVSGHDSSNKPLAYMLLGPKKSGNIYNKQDFRIIEIIADELVIAIQNALRFEEIQGFAATLQDKVNKATYKLQKTNKKLREMDETKDEFISMASHQLRTPLTSVKGYMSMVMEGDAGKLSKQQKQLLDQAFVSSQRMVYLIADLLNVSRLKTGKFIIDAVPTNLAEVIEGEVTQLKETAKRKNITLNYNKPKDFPHLMLDETKIRQVIMNFADNAIYYTPSGGKVEIDLKEDKKNIYFRVKDDGIGVPKAEKQHMFTKFYRAKNARKARPDGTGLGLFMAKKVVDAQGGQILFESEEGKGSTFGFCFNKHDLVAKKK